MHPILFRIGEFEIHSFGLMMALAWLAASYYLDVQFRRQGFPRDAVSDLVLGSLGGALIGARILYLVVEYPAWLDDVWGAILSRSGFVFYGGFFGGVAGGVWSVRRRGLSVRAVADLVAPALGLGLFFGRIGCFLAGDDYGRPAGVPWAVTFTDPRALAPLGVALHPTQLYLSGNGLALFAVLHVVLGRKRFDGQVFSLFLILYAITRFSLEFFRGDPRGQYGPLSTSQMIGLMVLPTGLWLYRKWKSEGAKKQGTGQGA